LSQRSGTILLYRGIAVLAACMWTGFLTLIVFNILAAILDWLRPLPHGQFLSAKFASSNPGRESQVHDVNGSFNE